MSDTATETSTLVEEQEMQDAKSTVSDQSEETTAQTEPPASPQEQEPEPPAPRVEKKKEKKEKKPRQKAEKKKGRGVPVSAVKENAKKVSSSAKAGLAFPVGRIARYLRNGRYAPRFSATSAVYMASVLEYLIFEVCEIAGHVTKENKQKRITPRYIQLAVRNDEELNELLKDVVIAGGGVQPHIHTFLSRVDKKKLRNTVEKSVSQPATETSA